MLTVIRKLLKDVRQFKYVLIHKSMRIIAIPVFRQTCWALGLIFGVALKTTANKYINLINLDIRKAGLFSYANSLKHSLKPSSSNFDNVWPAIFISVAVVWTDFAADKFIGMRLQCCCMVRYVTFQPDFRYHFNIFLPCSEIAMFWGLCQFCSWPVGFKYSDIFIL